MKKLKNVIAREINLEDVKSKFGDETAVNLMLELEAMKEYNMKEYCEDSGFIYKSGLIVSYFDGILIIAEEISENEARNIFGDEEVEEQLWQMNIDGFYVCHGDMLATNSGLVIAIV